MLLLDYFTYWVLVNLFSLYSFTNSLLLNYFTHLLSLGDKLVCCLTYLFSLILGVVVVDEDSEVVMVTAAAGALGLATVDLAANVFGAQVNVVKC